VTSSGISIGCGGSFGRIDDYRIIDVGKISGCKTISRSRDFDK